MAFDWMGFLYFLEPYVLVMILMWFALAKLTDGLLVKYLTVRINRNQKALVMVKGRNRRNFWLVGEKGADTVTFYWKKAPFWKKDETQREIIKVTGDVFYTFGLVDAINIDEETKQVLTPGLGNGHYYDFELMDSLFQRALYRPDLNEGNEKAVLIIVILILLGVIGCVFLLYQLGKKVDAVYKVVSSLNQVK